jgi:hypothetical protein
MKLTYCLFFLIVYQISFGQSTNKRFTFNKDSLKVSINCEDSKLTNEFYDFKGIRISKWYRIIDTLDIDINYDKVNDKILVLSPLSQIYIDSFTCEESKLPRLLMVLLAKGKRYSVSYVNDKAILNTYDYQNDPFEGIEKNKKGIILKFEVGSIIQCNYQFDFSITKSGLQLYSKRYNCFNKGNPDIYKKRRQVYTKKRYFLKSIDIQNFVEIPNLLGQK